MLIFLYGENTSLSLEKLRGLKRSFLSKNPAGEGLSEFELGIKDRRAVESLAAGLSEQSLFANRRLIIAKNFLANGDQETNKAVVGSLRRTDAPASQDVVVFWEEKDTAKGSLAEFLLSAAKCQRFDRLDGGRMKKRIAEIAQETNPEIELAPAALNLLAELAETEDIAQEIRKIATFKTSGRVELAEAEQLLSDRFGSRIFEAVGALLGGNRGRAAEMLRAELSSGQDPYWVFSMYAYQLRSLLKISEAWEQGLRSPRDIARAAALSPFVVEKNLSQVRGRPLAEIKKVFGRLAELDQQVKTGRLTIEMALDLLVAGA